MLCLVKPQPDECVTAYWAWMEEFPEESDRTDWLINELEATQPDALADPRPVSLSQIQCVVRRVAQQFSTLACYIFPHRTLLWTYVYFRGRPIVTNTGCLSMVQFFTPAKSMLFRNSQATNGIQ